MAYLPDNSNDYNFFETGVVLECSNKNATCKVQRTEGGVIDNVPILNTMGGGGQTTDVVWSRKLVGAHVVMIPIQGVLFVLATIPPLGTVSQSIV